MANSQPKITLDWYDPESPECRAQLDGFEERYQRWLATGPSASEQIHRIGRFYYGYDDGSELTSDDKAFAIKVFGRLTEESALAEVKEDCAHARTPDAAAVSTPPGFNSLISIDWQCSTVALYGSSSGSASASESECAPSLTGTNDDDGISGGFGNQDAGAVSEPVAEQQQQQSTQEVKVDSYATVLAKSSLDIQKKQHQQQQHSLIGRPSRARSQFKPELSTIGITNRNRGYIFSSTYSSTISPLPSAQPSPRRSISLKVSSTDLHFPLDFIRRSRVIHITGLISPVTDPKDLHQINRLYGLTAAFTSYVLVQIEGDAERIAAADAATASSSSSAFIFFDLAVESPFHFALFRLLFDKLHVSTRLAFVSLFAEEADLRQAQNIPTLLEFLRNTALDLCKEFQATNRKEIMQAREAAERAARGDTSEPPKKQIPYCNFCRFSVGHKKEHCPVLRATLCHKCFNYGHSKNHCKSENPPLLPAKWLSVGEVIYQRAKDRQQPKAVKKNSSEKEEEKEKKEEVWPILE